MSNAFDDDGVDENDDDNQTGKNKAKSLRSTDDLYSPSVLDRGKSIHMGTVERTAHNGTHDSSRHDKTNASVASSNVRRIITRIRAFSALKKDDLDEEDYDEEEGLAASYRTDDARSDIDSISELLNPSSRRAGNKKTGTGVRAKPRKRKASLNSNISPYTEGFIDKDVFHLILKATGVVLTDQELLILADATDTHPMADNVRYTLLVEALVTEQKRSGEHGNISCTTSVLSLY